jgi:hypothetical protein
VIEGIYCVLLRGRDGFRRGWVGSRKSGQTPADRIVVCGRLYKSMVHPVLSNPVLSVGMRSFMCEYSLTNWYRVCGA